MLKKLNELDYVKSYKITSLIAIVFMAVGLISLLCLPFGVHLFNYDVDFIGGTTLQYDLHIEVTPEVTKEVSRIFTDTTGMQESSVTKAGDSGTQVLIKCKELDSETRDQVFEALRAAYNLPEEDTPIKSDYVSASVGSDLRKSAVKASVLAVLLILVYITIRFELRSGIAAVCSLVHDLLVMLSIYVIFQIPFNMNFIAAALTILGYSINATIVVFDRIRENRRLYQKVGFSEIVNRSIGQTMGRSINTTVTTLLAILMLVIFGVSSIRTFAIPVSVGVVAGCFSSVFLSGPMWNLLVSKKTQRS